MKNIFITTLLFLTVVFCSAQEKYVPSQENLTNREWFRDAKFGMFIHWGIYSMLADGEWVLTNKSLNEAEYQKLADGFYPSKFNADEWVRIAKDAGMKYICFTSRHHDGFSMFDTKQSDYNIVKATPFKRDVIKELAEACQKHGLKLFFYYSHIDWHRPDYYPWGRTGRNTGRTPSGTWEDYLKFMDAQLTELLTNYGPIGGIWFDGWWDHDQDPGFDWQLPEQYAMIHRLQPACLIGNNHHQVPFAGEDIQIFERDLPGENNAGLSGQDISRLPLETCETMNGMWGYKIVDQNYKSVKTLIHYLVKAAGRNANLLMNIGPQPNGELPAAALERLKAIGEWTKQYGETIYGTRGGDISPRDWGVTTRKGDKLYVHILNLPDKGLFLPLTTGKVKSAVVFKDRKPVKFSQDKNGVVLELAEVPAELDYVIELTIK